MAKFPSKGSSGGTVEPLVYHPLTSITEFGAPYNKPEVALDQTGVVRLRGLGVAKSYNGGDLIAQITASTMWPKNKKLLLMGNGNAPNGITLCAVLPEGKIVATLEIISWIPVFDGLTFDAR